MNSTDNSKKDTTREVTINQNASLSEAKPHLTIDVDYYQDIIDDPDVSEDRKRELIEIVGNIVLQFIDIGFGVHAVQLARDEKSQKLTTQFEAKTEEVTL